MALWDPTMPNALAHAGTFNNNTISMSAGFTGLTEVFTASVASNLFNKGEKFKDKLNDLCKRYDVNLQVTGVGSILGLHVRDGVILQPPKYSSSDLNKLKLIHLEMSLRGFLFAQRGYMTLNIEMKDIHLEKFVNAFEDVIVSHKDIFGSRV
jgi:glutamate-1-semialdehyde 2,1-aminomutase